MNENGLLGFLAPSRHPLPTRGKEAGLALPLPDGDVRQAHAAAPAFRTLESGRRAPRPRATPPGRLYSLLPASTFIFLGNH